MNINLFKLAMERLQPDDWARFEQLASAFLSTEFSNLRTMASPGGDGGRDSELLSAGESPNVVAQYSVADDWMTKIRRTVTRLKESFPEVSVLIYATSKIIGAKADKLRREIRQRNIHLDIRDRNWFIERAAQNATTEGAAELLIDQIARPYLAGEQIIETKSSSLTSQEAKAALLYLGLQWEDDIREKGLTKLSFEALVRAALRNTDSEHRLSRANVHKRILAYLPGKDEKGVAAKIDSALKRLEKRYLRYRRPNDEYCLTYEEAERLKGRVAIQEEDRGLFIRELERLCEEQISLLPDTSKPALSDLVTRVQRVLDRFMLQRGEVFAAAVASERLSDIGLETLPDIVIKDVDQFKPSPEEATVLPNAISNVINRLVADITPATHKYLRCLSDSYTLYAFLCEVPDVQRATRKMFSHGEIWLDTTVVLPLFAEILLEEDKRTFTHLFRACVEGGASLRVTGGVITEIYTHMAISQSCSNYSAGTWRGRIPFLYYHYIETGRNPDSFSQWLELFYGTERPKDDIADYLSHEFGIERGSLEEVVADMPEQLRFTVQGLWLTAHEERRGKGRDDYDPSITTQLVSHDVENYLGVIGLRQEDTVSEFGYKQWWLTIDGLAWQIRNTLRQELGDAGPSSPLIGLDFLVKYLSFSPSRSHLSKQTERALPILLDFDVLEFLPKEMLKLAEEVRHECKDLPEYVIRRRVRDRFDRMKMQRGPLTQQVPWGQHL